MIPQMDPTNGYDQPSDRPPSFDQGSDRMSTDGRCIGNEYVIVLVFT